MAYLDVSVSRVQTYLSDEFDGAESAELGIMINL